jgi:hypothetical protein
MSTSVPESKRVLKLPTVAFIAVGFMIGGGCICFYRNYLLSLAQTVSGPQRYPYRCLDRRAAIKVGIPKNRFKFAASVYFSP